MNTEFYELSFQDLVILWDFLLVKDMMTFIEFLPFLRYKCVNFVQLDDTPFLLAYLLPTLTVINPILFLELKWHFRHLANP